MTEDDSALHLVAVLSPGSRPADVAHCTVVKETFDRQASGVSHGHVVFAVGANRRHEVRPSFQAGSVVLFWREFIPPTIPISAPEFHGSIIARATLPICFLFGGYLLRPDFVWRA